MIIEFIKDVLYWTFYVGFFGFGIILGLAVQLDAWRVWREDKKNKDRVL